MRRQFNRRQVAALVGSAVLLSTRQVEARQSPAASMHLLGASQQDWESRVGTGTPAGDFVAYTVEGIDAPVTVAYTDGIASFFEIDFTSVGAQGVARDVADQTVSSLFANGTAPVEMFFLLPDGEHTAVYTLSAWQDSTGEGLASMVVQEVANTGINPDPTQFTHALRVSASLPSQPEITFAATGTPGGIGMSKADWVAAYGEPTEADAEVETYTGVTDQGLDVAVFYMPQADVIQRIDGTADAASMKAITEISALEFCQNSVPADATMLEHCWFPATDSGPLAMRTMRLQSATVADTLNYEGAVLVVLFEKPDDPKPMVHRLALLLDDQQFIDAPAS